MTAVGVALAQLLLSLLLVPRWCATGKVGALASPPPPPPPHEPPLSPGPFYVLDPEDFRSRYPTDESFTWATTMVPFVDAPEANYTDVLTAFYYRTRSYREHVVWTGAPDGFVVTEFLPNVSWAGEHNAIPAAAGHHILEGRWFWDERIIDDYVRFWFRAGSGRSTVATYTNWILSAAWQGYLVTGNMTALETVVAAAADEFRTTYVEQWLTNSSSNAPTWRGERLCWRQTDGSDAMEVSVSGTGCRPTIASCMFGEASVIAAISKDSEMATEFERWADFSRRVVLDQHWNSNRTTFSVIPPPAKKGAEESRGMGVAGPREGEVTCDLAAMRPPNRVAPVRELLSFMPWYFGAAMPMGTLVPPNANESAGFARQFRSLLPSAGDHGYTATWGLRTLARSNSCYNYSWTHGDCWNGPTWPFETSRVLTAVGNMLNGDFGEAALRASGMTVSYLEELIRQYARQHTRSFAVNDTASPPGSGHIFENMHADLGYWNNRQRMYWSGSSNRNMGDDYNHSTFIDLVLSILFGIRPGTTQEGSVDGHWLVVSPLFDPHRASYFAVDHVKYRGRVLSVFWDSDGKRYGKGAGLTVMVDGNIVAHRENLGKLIVPAAPARLHEKKAH